MEQLEAELEKAHSSLEALEQKSGRCGCSRGFHFGAGDGIDTARAELLERKEALEAMEAERNELQSAREADTQQIQTLESRLQQLESERDALESAHKEAQSLREDSAELAKSAEISW